MPISATARNFIVELKKLPEDEQRLALFDVMSEFMPEVKPYPDEIEFLDMSENTAQNPDDYVTLTYDEFLKL